MFPNLVEVWIRADPAECASVVFDIDSGGGACATMQDTSVLDISKQRKQTPQSLSAYRLLLQELLLFRDIWPPGLFKLSDSSP